jgi:cardiolipin synthase A/B
VGSHRLGSTARPGALLPSQAAARPGVLATLIYSLAAKPLRQRHAREPRSEAKASGVRRVHSGKIPLHGKFLAWDDDDLVIASQLGVGIVRCGLPGRRVGVHVRCDDIAPLSLDRLSETYPHLLVGN